MLISPGFLWITLLSVEAGIFGVDVEQHTTGWLPRKPQIVGYLSVLIWSTADGHFVIFLHVPEFPDNVLHGSPGIYQ